MDPVRVIVNEAGPAFSPTSAALAEMPTAGSTLSRIVSVCVAGEPSTAPTGFASVTMTVSSGSAMASLMIVSGSSLTVSPAAKVTVPGASV